MTRRFLMAEGLEGPNSGFSLCMCSTCDAAADIRAPLCQGQAPNQEPDACMHSDLGIGLSSFPTNQAFQQMAKQGKAYPASLGQKGCRQRSIVPAGAGASLSSHDCCVLAIYAAK